MFVLADREVYYQTFTKPEMASSGRSSKFVVTKREGHLTVSHVVSKLIVFNVSIATNRDAGRNAETPERKLTYKRHIWEGMVLELL